MISLHLDKNILLVDCSYCVFFRYYSTLTWYKLQKYDVIDYATISFNDVFRNKYRKIFEKSIADLSKTYDVPWCNIVFVKDAPRDELWRNALFKEYKNDRDSKRDTFDKNIFKFTYDDVIPSMIDKFEGVQLIGVNKLEADDIIGIIKKQVREVSSETKIVILTNDNDYIQLHDDHTIITNLKNQMLCSRILVPVNQYIKYKIIMGDKSDCIPAICKKVGEKTAKKLIDNPANLESLLEKDPTAKERFDLNEKLISMDRIPEEYVKIVRDSISFLL